MPHRVRPMSTLPFKPFDALSRSLKMLVLGGVVLLVYGFTLGHEYAVDDMTVLSENRFVQQGFSGIGALLTHDSFEGRNGDDAHDAYEDRYYRPLSLMTFAVEYQFFGANPFISHFLNLVIYALTGGMLFLLLFRLGLAETLAFWIALLFLLHPLHTEAVANVKGRDELLSFLFLMLAWYLCWGWLVREDRTAASGQSRPTQSPPGQRKRTGRNKRSAGQGATAHPMPASYLLLGGGMAYFLALLSKEHGFTFLGIFPLAVLTFRPDRLRSLGTVFLVLLGAVLLYTFLRISVIGFPPPLEAQSVLDDYYLHVDPDVKYASLVAVLGFYVKLLFFPYPLSWDYSYAQVPYHTFADPFVWAVLILLLLLTAAALYQYWRYWRPGFQRPQHRTRDAVVYAFCWLYFLASVSIISNLVINIGGYVGERFLYQGSLGFVWAVGLLTWRGAERLSRVQPSSQVFSRIITVSLIVLAGLYAAWSWDRSLDWRDNPTLFIADVEACPNSVKVNAACGGAHITRANRPEHADEKTRMLREAQVYLKKATRIHPDYIYPWLDLSRSWFQLGNRRRAEALWDTARALDSTDAVLLDRGKELAVYHQDRANQLLGQPKAYLESVKRVLHFYKTDPEIWFNAGQGYVELEDYRRSIYYFQQAAARDPQNPKYHYALGVSWYYLGNWPECQSAWRTVLNLQPGHAQAREGLNYVMNNPPPARLDSSQSAESAGNPME